MSYKLYLHIMGSYRLEFEALVYTTVKEFKCSKYQLISIQLNEVLIVSLTLLLVV